MFPTSRKEVEALGWDYIDIIFFTGDAFVDHPSFGCACISRWLQKFGYRIAIVPQPNWRDDLRDFRKLGAPRLYYAVNAGAMDSMVNHYTAGKRLRHDDAYTPDGKAGARPDYAVSVYSRILKELYPDVPVVIGGVEASLRRLTHYDYWKDELLHESDLALQSLKEEKEICTDIADRASTETTLGYELRSKERARKLISKIDDALAKIKDGTYGYCEDTGEPIDLRRLEARPTATLSIQAQERHEKMEKTQKDD